VKRPYLLILVASVLFLRAASPTPTPRGQNEQQGSQSADQIEPQPQNTKPAMATQKKGEAACITKRKDNQNAPVVVAPVDVTKSVADYLLIACTIIFSGALVAVGALQVGLLYGMRREAALSERAWIAFKLEKVEGLDEVLKYQRNPAVLDEQIVYVLLGFKYSTINSGKTVARVINASINATCITAEALASLPAEPNYPKAAHKYAPFLLVPNRRDPYKEFLALDRDDVKALLAGEIGLMFYGFVQYRDVLEKPHESRCCMIYRPTKQPHHIVFRFDGPDAYNQYA
jgi:hypothetical protein